MKHQRKTQRAPQKHGSRRKKKTMRRRRVRSKAKKKTGGWGRKALKSIYRSLSSGSNATATAKTREIDSIKKCRTRLTKLLVEKYRDKMDEFPIAPTVEDLRRDTGKGNHKIWRAIRTYFNRLFQSWKRTDNEDLELEKRLEIVYDIARDQLEKDETKKQEKDQEKHEKEQTFLERDDYKKVVTAIAKPNIQVGDVDTIMNYIFEDEPPEDLTEVKDLDVLKDPIKKLEKIIKEELDSDTDSKQWLQGKLSDSVKEEIKRRTNTDTVAGIWNRQPATVLPDQSKISESGRQLPTPGSFFFLRILRKKNDPDYGMKLAMVTCINDDTFHYVVCNEEGVFMTDDTYMQMQDLRPLTLENETFLWTRTEQEELDEINQDHKRLLSEEGLARISPPFAPPPFAPAPPAPQYQGDPSVVVLAKHVQEENTHNESSVKQSSPPQSSDNSDNP